MMIFLGDLLSQGNNSKTVVDPDVKDERSDPKVKENKTPGVAEKPQETSPNAPKPAEPKNTNLPK
jgi:hypothetical protein